MLLTVLMLVAPAYATYDATNDYMSDVIEALVTGDYAAAEAAMRDRDEKIRGEGLDRPTVKLNELDMLSRIIYAEAGSSWLTDEHQRLVGSVVLNRMASPEFPDTMEEVLEQPGQYYGENSPYFEGLVPDRRAVENALYLLEHGSIAPGGVVFQSNYVLGSGIYVEIADEHLGSSYFCWSSRPELYEGA